MVKPRTHAKERSAWYNMKQRCYNKRSTGYHLYGGRGIRMCEKWLYSFSIFYKDMGDRPVGTSMDRIDVNGNYEPGNCRWGMISVQNRNKTTNINLTYNGKTQCVQDWENELGLPRDLARRRIKRGWETERALTTPSAKQRNPLFTS